MEKASKRIKNKLVGLAVVVLLLLPATQTVSAHDGQPPAPHDLWSAWNWDPVILTSLLLAIWIYAKGQRELRRRSGLQPAPLNRRAAAFTAGMITLFLALVSPLDALSAALFSAHMLQHMLLIVVAPPLLILGVTPGSFLLGLAPSARRDLGGWWQQVAWLKPAWQALTQPWAAWALNVLIVWVWHAPGLYQSALQNEALHMLEHLTFVGSSLLFWWAIIHPNMHLGRGDPGMISLFTMGMQSGLLGALITFAPSPWYALYTSTTQAWGLSPLEDQQLAGAIMWIPVGAIYTLAALILFVTHLAWVERAAQQREVE
jgi:putative membrane protein